MIVTLIGTLGLIVTTVIGVLGGRNDRAQANLEADLLAKLDTDSESAKRLREVIHGRITRWHGRMFKEPPSDPIAKELEMRRDVGPVRFWLAIGLSGAGVVGGIVLAIVSYHHGTPNDSTCLLLLCPSR